MAETRTRPPAEDPHNPPRVGVVGDPHPPADQPQPRTVDNGLLIRLGGSLRALEIAELALSAAGMTWWLLTHIAGMGHGPAIFPAVLACVFTARAAHHLRIRAASEAGECDACGGVIRRGDRYVAINRHVERQDRRGITVDDAEGLATYHPSCAPTIAEATPEDRRSR